jgi:phosphinothricin acetyltransferase
VSGFSRTRLTLDSAVTIDDAQETDLAEILAIYNQVIADSTAVFSETLVTLEDRVSWFGARTGQGYPILVARDPSGVAGYATFGDFRTWPGYRFTVEHSVHVRADARGRGTGSRLVSALIPRAQALGKHVMIGGIDADNTASIRMHERLGFERSAHMKQVGWKFGRWLDLVFMQKLIGAVDGRR